MSVIVTPQKEIDKYFDSSVLGQSSLKELNKGFDAYLTYLAIQKKKKDDEEDEKPKDYFIIGDAVDKILTGEEDSFDNKYHVSDVEKTPTEKELPLIKQVFDQLKVIKEDKTLSECEDLLLQAAIDQNWYSGKPGKRLYTLMTNYVDYFEDLKLAEGKLVISKTIYDTILNITNSLRNDNRTSRYFDKSSQDEYDNIDFYYQLPIYFTYKGLKVKALLDLVIVSKDDSGKIKEIQPIDLKTMSGYVTEFVFKLKKFRYDIQAAWYTLALRTHFNTKEIKPFIFIVESSTNIGRPLVYQVGPDILDIGKNGRDSLRDPDEIIIRREIRGYDSLVDEYMYYVTQEWKEDLRTYDKNIIKLNWEGIMGYSII